MSTAQSPALVHDAPRLHFLARRTDATIAPHRQAAGGADSKKILDIERLRALAILSILLYHVGLGAALMRRVGLEPFRSPLWLGVDLFFVISGFVVTKSFLAKRMHFVSFYTRRIFRLWPVLLVFFAEVALVNALNSYGPADWAELGRQVPSVLFGYYTLRPALHDGYTGHMWSLSVEEQFYLAAPWILFACGLAFRNRARAGAWLFLGIAAVVGGVLRFGIHLGPLYGHPALARVPLAVSYVEAAKFDLLALGVALYFQTQARRLLPLERLSVPWQRLLLLLALASPLVVAYRLKVSPDYFSCTRLRSYGILVTGLCFYLVVRLAGQNRDLLRCGRLCDQALLWLGSRSYGTYVLHVPLLVLSKLILLRFLPQLRYDGLTYGLVQAALFIALCVPVIELTYRWVEKPAIRLGLRLTSPQPAAPPSHLTHLGPGAGGTSCGPADVTSPTSYFT
jgi:peptidoglycan/LPS O-acetylase OafA/YrhL